MSAVKEKESANLIAPIGADSFSPVPLDLLVCPACLSSREDHTLSDDFRCGECAAEFPRIDMPDGSVVPWLFAHPDAAFAQWGDRYARLIHETRAEIARYDEALRGEVSNRARARLAQHGAALVEFAEQLERMLRPYDLQSRVTENPARQQLSKAQTITSYMANVFRDWVWGAEEVHAAAEVLNNLLAEASHDDLGTMLTLGAGPGALPFLLERTQKVTRSIKFDINPLFARIHAAMRAGEALDLYEFPFAPIDGLNTAVLRRLEAANLTDQVDGGCDSSYILGDISDLPFRTGAFDTVLTPWLIDILPEPVDQWLAGVNRLLKPGGVWMFTGSMSFESEDPVKRFSPEEFFDRAQAFGFAIEARDYSTLPYLHSPVSAHCRYERVVSFVATKTRDCSAVPAMRADHNVPVPASPTMQYACSNYMLRAQILGAVNGERSITEIAAAIARRYELDEDAALETVEQILDQHGN